MKKLLAAVIGSVFLIPAVAGAVTETGNIASGDSVDLFDGSGVANGYNYNASFVDGDAAGVLTFEFTNNLAVNAAIVLSTSTINQIVSGGDKAVFISGVNTDFNGQPTHFTPEGALDSFQMVTNVAAGGSFKLIYTFGDPMVVGSGIAPEIDFNLIATAQAVPLPAALPLFVGALAGLGLVSRRRAA